MNLAPGSALSLAPAQPGYEVLITNGGQRETCPLVAWAVVVTEPETGDQRAVTTVEPVFLYHGVVNSSTGFREAYGDDYAIAVREP